LLPVAQRMIHGHLRDSDVYNATNNTKRFASRLESNRNVRIITKPQSNLTNRQVYGIVPILASIMGICWG